MKPIPSLVQKVRSSLEQLGAGSERMVVAVSGGPDSVALLHALVVSAHPPADARQPTTLIVAHLNHQLRGAESDVDEAFVRQLHADLATLGMADLKLYCERIDIRAEASAQKENLQSAARKVRYRWLADVARREQAPYVITGHTADDQAETVLHRLLRGAGLRGLRGIAARRPLRPGIELLRPMLGVRKQEVLDCLREQSLAYRVDSSNLDLHYTRNRIRNELLPLLEKNYNPAIVSLLNRLARQASDAYCQVEERARQLLSAAERPRAGQILVLDRHCLSSAPQKEVCEMFRLLWQREGWPVSCMNHDAWERLAGLAFGEIPALDLPGRVRAQCREHVVQLTRGG